MNQLSSINLRLPVIDQNTSQAFSELTNLLKTACFPSSQSNSINLSSTVFPSRLPSISLGSHADDKASVFFDDQHQIALPKPNLGEIEHERSEISLRDVIERFDGSIMAVDHIGINFSPTMFALGQIESIMNFLKQSSNFYQYPESKPWYFVVPATIAEHEFEISDFSKERGPKFELVIETEISRPLIQIDLLTDLKRDAVEKLLPDPYGVSFEGLSEFFRSTFIKHPWQFDLRLDFRYADGMVNEWNSAKFLVTEGERIK